MNHSPYGAGADDDARVPDAAIARLDKTLALKDSWLPLWRECYRYAMPMRAGAVGGWGNGAEQIFDATAADAADQLAASMLAELTPPWARWFGFVPGPEAEGDDAAGLAKELERAAVVMQMHFDRSNFAVEVHQCYLDLVVAGSNIRHAVPAPVGEPSAFRFTAVPLAELALREGASGRLDTVMRVWSATAEALSARFPDACDCVPGLARLFLRDPDATAEIAEQVAPDGQGGYEYLAFVRDGGWLLRRARLAASPFICFRWLKAPGEAYGRSPVMKALPDIKTANKIVELVLKNATIACTGIWQAEDDGVLNPANIRLVPGAIIPKAVGSRGLTPLEAPGKFDVSELMLKDLRARIGHALLADRLGQVDSPALTATEVLERSAAMARILGATYGRLQSELLTPLVVRGLEILAARGEVPSFSLDGRRVALQYRSPLARQQSQADAGAAMRWLQAVASMGPEAQMTVDFAAAARWLAQSLCVPLEMVLTAGQTAAKIGQAVEAVASLEQASQD
ncbi:hypothetical protein FACS1894186_3180 [Alphaproteobacteria bacterium]|nr:hypothetical protein FACS1894186_3180 [Alphaproteobacteria bacterium]